MEGVWSQRQLWSVILFQRFPGSHRDLSAGLPQLQKKRQRLDEQLISGASSGVTLSRLLSLYHWVCSLLIYGILDTQSKVALSFCLPSALEAVTPLTLKQRVVARYAVNSFDRWLVCVRDLMIVSVEDVGAGGTYEGDAIGRGKPSMELAVRDGRPRLGRSAIFAEEFELRGASFSLHAALSMQQKEEIRIKHRLLYTLNLFMFKCQSPPVSAGPTLSFTASSLWKVGKQSSPRQQRPSPEPSKTKHIQGPLCWLRGHSTELCQKLCEKINAPNFSSLSVSPSRPLPPSTSPYYLHLPGSEVTHGKTGNFEALFILFHVRLAPRQTHIPDTFLLLLAHCTTRLLLLLLLLLFLLILPDTTRPCLYPLLTLLDTTRRHTLTPSDARTVSIIMRGMWSGATPLLIMVLLRLGHGQDVPLVPDDARFDLHTTSRAFT
ncbi:hypothetical protein EYF80_016803 [Liparis tanakae]|uniref:Uncharacterized protein n=1 Tax=Liparis tanakae TaxID=230148 RepID=A0A4Z2I760_9TELE|nr:hypothetical protein EYF80_016803 [Liparis tanakae]